MAGGFFTTEPPGKVKERELLYRVRPWAPVMDVKSVIALGVWVSAGPLSCFLSRAFLFPSQETMTTWQSLGLKTALNNAAAIARFLNQLWYVSGNIFLSRTHVEIKHWKTVTACFLTAEEWDHLATRECPQTSSPQPSRHLQPTLFFLISQGITQGDAISIQKPQKLKHQTKVPSFLSRLCRQPDVPRTSAPGSLPDRPPGSGPIRASSLPSLRHGRFPSVLYLEPRDPPFLKNNTIF